MIMENASGLLKIIEDVNAYKWYQEILMFIYDHGKY